VSIIQANRPRTEKNASTTSTAVTAAKTRNSFKKPIAAQGSDGYVAEAVNFFDTEVEADTTTQGMGDELFGISFTGLKPTTSTSLSFFNTLSSFGNPDWSQNS
jgi:pyruvoyl-dependent arginine decarboxylase (PvlArgDC)